MNLHRMFWVNVSIFVSLINFANALTDVNPSSSEGNYKILVLLPFGSESHRNCFLPLVEALGDRGHEVVMLSGLPPKCKHPKVKEINHGIEVFDPELSLFEVREKDPSMGFSSLKLFLPKIARELYEIPTVKELYDKKDEFDVMIIDNMFNEPAYPFLAGRKYIALDTAGVIPVSSAILGNVLNPAFVPTVLTDFPRPYSFMNRLKNMFQHLALPIYWRHYEVVPLVQKEISARFPDLPSLLEIERGVGLVLMNSHFTLDASYPLLPSQVEVGCMHCNSGNKLPQDLQAWIDGAGPDGVIYFSLGSVCQGKSIPPKYKKILVEVFQKLKQRVIWKFEEEFKELPSNIIVRKWLPQQDILAHPNVKLFITHGGLLSMQEAIFHEKPLLALPVFGDQERNAEKIAHKGFGKYIFWEELTVDIFEKTVKSIINNPQYYKTVSSTSKMFRDQPFLPVEKAVWWIEYFVRHNGAPQLRCPGADLSWIEYLMLDVIFILHLIVFALYFITKKICKIISSKFFGKKQERKKKKE